MNSVLSAKSGCQISFYAHTLMGAPAIPQVQVGFAVVAENEGRELFEGLQKTGFVFPEHS